MIVFVVVRLCPLRSGEGGGGGGGRRKEGERRRALIKSHNPHRAGGEKTYPPEGDSPMFQHPEQDQAFWHTDFRP